MSKKMLEKQAETKTAKYRIDVTLGDVGIRSVYCEVVGIPKELPDSYENTVARAAGLQFMQMLNQRTFLETYTQGKTINDELPVMYNLKQIQYIKIINTQKVA